MDVIHETRRDRPIGQCGDELFRRGEIGVGSERKVMSNIS